MRSIHAVFLGGMVAIHVFSVQLYIFVVHPHEA